MKLARSLERRLEQLVEGISNAVFGGKLQPIDLANRLVREADLSVTTGPAGPTIPNHFVVRLHPDELGDPAAVAPQLARVIETEAANSGWRLDGPARIEFVHDPGAPPGTVRCRATTVAGARPPWGDLAEETLAYPLTHNRELIGRGESADVRLVAPEVSRAHAVIWREGGKTWIHDLNSANGTMVNGRPVTRHTYVAAGARLTFGPVALTFRPR